MDTEHPTEFYTRDLGLAVSLMADGVQYLRTERDSTDNVPRRLKRLIFVFENAESEISRIQQQRANGNHVVSSTHYEDCQRRLKSIIHNFDIE